MYYIIFDLEWNNVYNYKLKQGLNEIIEIGAVKLNESLEIVETFKQLIKPSVSNKLDNRFKNLTHITMEEIKKDGIPFNNAFSDFARWSRGRDNVFLSWSTSDLYALADNFKRFKGNPYVKFISKYADAQKYCMQFIENNDGNQIGLSNCARLFEIEVDTSALHRALEDCFVTACCLKKVFDKKKFEKFVTDCDVAFFERLVFKNYFLTDKDKSLYNVNNESLVCPVCSGTVEPIRYYDFANNSFKSVGQCKKCRKKFWLFIRAKKTYDGILVSKRLIPVNKKRAKHLV